MRCAAIIGDIHAQDRNLALVLQKARAEGVDAVLAVGDIVDGDGDVERCIELLEEHRVLAVSGNHERWLFENTMRSLPHAHTLGGLSDHARRFLRALPKTRSLSTAAGPLLLCHGLGDNDMRRLRPYDDGYDIDNNDELQALIGDGRYAFVAGGHTHLRMIRRFGPLCVLNAGTLAPEDEPCFLIVDFARKVARFYDVVSTRLETGPELSL